MRREHAPVVSAGLVIVLGLGVLVYNADRSNRPAEYVGDPTVVEEGVEVFSGRYARKPCGTVAVAATVSPQGVFEEEQYTYDADDIIPILAPGHNCGGNRELGAEADRVTVVSSSEQPEG